MHNAIVHGNKNDRSKKVFVRAIFKDDQLEFLIEDEGNGFDSGRVVDPTLPENLKKESGRGIFLIRKLADEVTFSNGGRKIQIKFFIQREHSVL